MLTRKFKKCYITGITGSGGSYLAEYLINHTRKLKVIGTYRGKKNLIL